MKSLKDVPDEVDEGTETTQEVMINDTIPRNNMSKVNEFDQRLGIALLLLIHHQNRTGIEMIQSLNLKPRLQLQQPLQDGTENLRRKVAIGVRKGIVGVGGGDEFAEDEGNAIGGEGLKEGSRRFPGGEGVLDAGEAEAKRDA